LVSPCRDKTNREVAQFLCHHGGTAYAPKGWALELVISRSKYILSDLVKKAEVDQFTSAICVYNFLIITQEPAIDKKTVTLLE